MKDILRLPRPAMPPVIQLESKWALEYGMPSTHAMVGLSVPLSILVFTYGRYQVLTLAKRLGSLGIVTRVIIIASGWWYIYSYEKCCNFLFLLVSVLPLGGPGCDLVLVGLLKSSLPWNAFNCCKCPTYYVHLYF